METKKWTVKQKMSFVNRTETLPEGVNKSDFISEAGISKRIYNGWVKRYGVTSIYAPVLDSIKRVDPTVVKMFEGDEKILYTVHLSIVVKSMDELTEVVSDIQSVPKVHNVNAVLGVEQYLD
jgi:hypothetical protein